MHHPAITGIQMIFNASDLRVLFLPGLLAFFQSFLELFHVNRFADVIIHAGEQALLTVSLQGMSSQCQDMNINFSAANLAETDQRRGTAVV